MVGVRFADSVEMAEREGNDGFDKTETDAFIQDGKSSFDDMDRDPAARPRNAQAKRRLIQSSMIPWILTCLFALTSFLLLLERYGIRKFGTYEDRLSTDLWSLRRVPLEVKRFVGSPKFDENGTMWMDTTDPEARWPENLRFTGDLTDEVDENWNEIVEDRYFSVSEAEAIEAWGDRRHEYVDEELGGYTAGLDVFHTLHCLNKVRKAIYPDRYGPESSVGTQKAHLDHCIDTIRQHIMCYGSTTPIPTKWREGAQRQHFDSNQDHVCRDFSYLHRYMTRRSQGGDLYSPRDKSLMGMAKAWENAWEEDDQPH